jgi:hypothetical protein
VNTEPLPGSLVTVTSPPIMRASLRELIQLVTGKIATEGICPYCALLPRSKFRLLCCKT